jgi:hypothetical protein
MIERDPPLLRSKCRRTEKISQSNEDKRKQYGIQYRYETVESLWQWIHWIDESYVDRAIAVDQYIFREREASKKALS